MKTALLFDLDGTLVDSDAEHLVAFQRVFAPHGIKLDRPEYAANIMGASNEHDCESLSLALVVPRASRGP